MKILILSATQQEIQPFLLTLDAVAIKPDVLIGGIGTTATAYHLTKQLHHHRYDLVIQAGLAGSFGNTIALGEIVIVKQDCFAELGAVEKNEFQSIQQMGFSVEPEWLVNKNPLLDKLPYRQVKAATINTVTDNTINIATLQQKWNADIETMEGAAMHYVCQHQQTNYLQIRGISNVVGDRDKKNWNITATIEKLNHSLTNILALL